MTLTEYQRYFSKTLFTTMPDNAWAQDEIKPAGQLDIVRAIEVYQNNYVGACINTLKQVYPICVRVLGEKYFTVLAREYVQKNPSKSSDLNKYGNCFSLFLSQTMRKQNLAETLPYINELAVLEWHMHAAYYETDDESFDWLSLQSLSIQEQEKLKPFLSKSIYLLSTEFPVDKVWTENIGSAPGEVIENEKAPYHLVISRKDYRVSFERVTVKEYDLLQMLRDSCSMQEFTLMAQAYNLVPTELLGAWMQKAWLVGMIS